MNKIDGRVHSQVAGLLSAYIDGQVTAGEGALVERHLATCLACARDLSTLRQTVRLLSQLPAVVAPRPFTLSQAHVAPVRPTAWRWAFGVPGLATGVAALLCAVSVGGLALVGRLSPGGGFMTAPIAPAPPATPVAYEQPRAARQAATVVAVEKNAAPAQELEAAAQPPLPAAEAPAEADASRAAAATPTAATTPAPTTVAVPEPLDQPGDQGFPPATWTAEETDVVQEKALPRAPEAMPTASPTPTTPQPSSTALAALGVAAVAPPAPAPPAEEPTAAAKPPQPEQKGMLRQPAGAAAATPAAIPNLMAVEELQLRVESGVIRASGRLPLPEGQPIQAELYRDGQRIEWATPETKRALVAEEGRFALELRARPDVPDTDLFGVAPAHYEVRIIPVQPAAFVEARILFDTYPPHRTSS